MMIMRDAIGLGVKLLKVFGEELAAMLTTSKSKIGLNVHWS